MKTLEVLQDLEQNSIVSNFSCALFTSFSCKLTALIYLALSLGGGGCGGDRCFHCSVTQSSLTLGDPTDCSTPGFPVLHHLPEFAQTHVHWVSDAIQASHPVAPFCFCPQSFPASGSFPIGQLFASGGQSIGASASASVLPMNSEGIRNLE